MARNLREYWKAFWEGKRVIVLAFSPNPRSKDYMERLAARLASDAKNRGAACVEQVVVTGDAAAKWKSHFRHLIDRKREKDDFDILFLTNVGLPPCSARTWRREAKLAMRAGIMMAMQSSSPSIWRRAGSNGPKEVGHE